MVRGGSCILHHGRVYMYAGACRLLSQFGCSQSIFAPEVISSHRGYYLTKKETLTSLGGICSTPRVLASIVSFETEALLRRHTTNADT